MYIPMVLTIGIHFGMLLAGKTRYPPVDACVSSGHLERPAGGHSGYRTGHADTRRHMDVRHEPEKHQQRNRNMVHRGCNLREKAHCLRSKESSPLSVPDVTVNTHRGACASYKPAQNGQ